MQITLLRAKIHRAVITQNSLDYEGSITIDLFLMKKVGFYPYEKVLIANISRGTRFETYVIPGKTGSGIIGLNGAAARLGGIGEKITIMAFTTKPPREAAKFKPKIIVLEKQNKIKKSS